MQIFEISLNEYKKYDDKSIIYNDGDFCELNKAKVDKIVYLLAKQGESPRFAFAIGIKDNVAKVPFSAPFMLPIEIKKKQSVERYDETITCLNEYFKNINIKSVIFIFPPIFYNSEYITAWINALSRHGYNAKYYDINYALNLKNILIDEYCEKIVHNARKNLQIALKSNLNLVRCDEKNQIKEAYAIIKENREFKGYPLRMTEEQVLNTIKIVNYDAFLIKKDNNNIAAALVYEVNDKISQVIYWGDKPGYGEFKPINFLSYELIKYYKNKGKHYLDIGPSTENGIPNYGLCDFKESIGCFKDLKITLDAKCGGGNNEIIIIVIPSFLEVSQ